MTAVDHSSSPCAFRGTSLRLVSRIGRAGPPDGASPVGRYVRAGQPEPVRTAARWPQGFVQRRTPVLSAIVVAHQRDLSSAWGQP